jgi:hypothetical protein
MPFLKEPLACFTSRGGNLMKASDVLPAQKIRFGDYNGIENDSVF